VEPTPRAILSLMRYLATLFLVVLSWPAAAKRPITHEDVWLMKRVGAPVVSPDGRHAVFSVTEPDYDPDKQVSDLWIVPVDGSAAPRRLTFTKGGENDPAWSPDSRRIAFVAKREGDEEAQIYVLSLDGGEAIRLTSLPTGASAPKWSPDGGSLLFESQVYPGAGDEAANKKIIEERKKRKYNARVYEAFPIRYWDRWLPETRPHLFLVEARPGATPRDLLAGTKLAGEPGFSGVGSGLGEYSLQAVWAPDGQSIVFAASVDRNQAAYAFTTSHLYQLPAAGTEPRALTSGNYSYSHPAFPPDGKALFALESRDGQKGRLYSLDRLALWSWPQPASATILTESFDRSVSDFAFTPDSSTIYLTAEDTGHDKLFVMPSGGGEVKPAFDVTLGAYSGLSSAGKSASLVLVANWQSMVNPPEVVRIDPAAGQHKPLSELNAERVAEMDWRPPLHFWFTSRRGARIHNMLVFPPAFDQSKKYPLLVFMHGGPHNMWKDQFFIRWNYHYLASAGFILLMTNYSGSTGFGEEFAEAINRDVLRLPTSEINEAADEAIKKFPFIDGTRQVAGGASYGGYLSNWMQATTTRYRALFNHAGLTDHDSMYGTTDGGYYWEARYGGPVWEGKGQWQDQNPLRYAGNFKTPMLVSHGEKDFRVPLGQGLEIYKLLQRQRVPAKLIVFPEENHWILKGENNRFYFEELFGWLKKWVE